MGTCSFLDAPFLQQRCFWGEFLFTHNKSGKDLRLLKQQSQNLL